MRIMYLLILKKDLSNFDTSSLLINSNYNHNRYGGRVFTQGDIYDLNENEEENSLPYERIMNTYNVTIFYFYLRAIRI